MDGVIYGSRPINGDGAAGRRIQTDAAIGLDRERAELHRRAHRTCPIDARNCGASARDACSCLKIDQVSICWRGHRNSVSGAADGRRSGNVHISTTG